MHHQHRRRKKRPSYGARIVEVCRGINGFGFTISGQQPCILSSIVANSPADKAGLRAGEFLISVNGLNVSKLPHESVVQSIGNSLGAIRMQIAENYFSDSSDDENIVSQINRVRPRYLHHKLKMNRIRNSPQKSRNSQNDLCIFNDQQISLHPVIEDEPQPTSYSIIHSASASTSKDISNVSAMVRKSDEYEVPSLEYRAIVGYLGTIEMPKQIATSSKLQTVRSCIRKIRQEKRNPTTVLMIILPSSLTLRSSNSTILATYPASRLNYVSSSSESENRFFGLVTSAAYANDDDDPIPLDGILAVNKNSHDIIISNSCHVFVVDTKICEHTCHEHKLTEFDITCTKDPISNLCLEFPSNSEYVVNLIRSMYTMKIMPPPVRKSRIQNENNENIRNARDSLLEANSPQPSNHSEVTTSSNSDSGIGFHNDCTNISDRIVVVDFPGLLINRNNVSNVLNTRPHAICNNIDVMANSDVNSNSKVLQNLKNNDTRLTVRAMPDPKVTKSSQKLDIPDLIASFDIKTDQVLTATRSCDNVITSVELNEYIPKEKKQLQMSIDDITMLGSNVESKSTNQDYEFLQPMRPIKKNKKPLLCLQDENSSESKLLSYKLSPKVFGVSRPSSLSYDNLTETIKKSNVKIFPVGFENWGSLQELHNTESLDKQRMNFLGGAYSEPRLLSRALPSNTSTFHRLGQSSFRATRVAEQKPTLRRRPSSLAASENDVYTKSINNLMNDTDNQQNEYDEYNKTISNKNSNETGTVTLWGTSFEKLLNDPAGLQTFAEFLKKEFSAENIYFWTACERYRQLDSNTERSVLAMEIFSKHLADGAIEPVNIDSHARNLTENGLYEADKNLMLQAQKQIFNLMKFDSYQRFIRSDLYKKCLEAEAKNQPLPYPGDQLDELLRITPISPTPSKLKKSASNAEDRRRKSLLPWHRKTRCKSRDRNEIDVNENKSNGKLQTLGLLSTNNSTSDIHSSKSSLSSFDATTSNALTNSIDETKVCSLCRVILSDGATTIVQTRQNETVRQLVERLLEKRGIHYNLFDVTINGDSKAIDLEKSATILAGKEVLIEQKITFKLDLPDPKVISVKSKPKKLLADVLKPILHKYNYKIDNVQVILRENHEILAMDMPVTVADGHRLQIVVKVEAYQQSQLLPEKAPKHNLTNYRVLQNQKYAQNHIKCPKMLTQQTTLDEITNKVFNELLQVKVESHSNQEQPSINLEQSSNRSDDCVSENSSIFERLRRKNSNNPDMNGVRPRKISTASAITNKNSTSVPEDAQSCSTNTTNSDPSQNGTRKPLIAKWKAGVKLQVTGLTGNHEEFLEGLKRAQRARLEDQRGTEINSELPDFLKNNENLGIITKLRKTQETINRINDEVKTTYSVNKRPQPAPRLSICKNINNINTKENNTNQNVSISGPPPLPPKPKVLPTKPSNWGHTSLSQTNLPSKIPVDISRRYLNTENSIRNIYLDQPSSSFV